MPVATGAKRKRGEGQWALGYREPLPEQGSGCPPVREGEWVLTLAHVRDLPL